MIDHVVVKTTPELLKPLITFYERALAPIGYQNMREIPGQACGFGDTKPDFWLMASGKGVDTAHVALGAKGALFSFCFLFY